MAMANVMVRDRWLVVALNNDGKIVMLGSQKEVTERFHEKTRCWWQ